MIKIILFVFGIFPLIFCYGQAQVGFETKNNNTSKNISPLPPEVASFARYGPYPVNLSSGTVNVDIPIYTIKTQQLEVPISISYSNSGIRVDDSPSSIGLGWTLNAGGVISVQVKGRQDSPPGYNAPYNAPTEDEILKLAVSQDRANAYSKIASLCYRDDTQADIYSYFVAGHIYGKFLYDASNNLHQIPLTDRRIEYITSNGSLLGKYIITSEDGTKYVFDKNVSSKTTITEYEGYLTHSSDNITGIHLTKIISADNKDSITFHYKTVAREYYSPNNPTYLAIKVSDNINYTNYYKQQKENNTVGYKDYFLEKIIFDGGIVNFTSTNDRKDYVPYRINKISVQTKGFGRNATILSCDLLNDEYFETNKKAPENSQKKFYYRLKLNGVKIKGDERLSSREQKEQLFQFHYNQTPLPPYPTNESYSWDALASNGQDMWGYYNGVTDNRHLLQYPNSEITKEEYLKFVNYNDANREVSEKYAKACSLEKIVFPTKGYTIFELESNRKDSLTLSGGLRIKSQKSYDANNDLLEEREYEYPIGGYEVAASNYLTASSIYKRKFIYQAFGWSGNGNTNPSQNIDYTYITSSPLVAQLLSSHPIHYSLVKEYIGGKSRSAGMKIYQYDYLTDRGFSIMGEGNAYLRYRKAFIDYSWARDQLRAEYSYKKEGNDYNISQKTTYEYNTFLESTFIIGLIVTNDFESIKSGGMGSQEAPKEDFHWFNTYGSTGAKKLEKKTVTDFLESGSISNEVIYSYDKINSKTNPHQQIVSETTIKSNGDKYISRYFYPSDYNYKVNAGFDYFANKRMRDANIINQPIEIIRSNIINNKDLVFDGVFYRFKDINELYEQYQLSLQSPISYPGASEINSGGYNKNQQYQLNKSFTFDDKNNIRSTVEKSDLSTTYLWSYSRKYPIVKIANSTYQTVENILTPLFINTLAEQETPPQNMLEEINSLREKLPNALVTTYTYTPLVGMTSATDPRGVITYYDYDTFGRLKETYIIENGVKKIIQVNDYHYQNQ